MEAVRNFSGEALASWRRRRQLSHDALTELVGISRSNLIAYEKGRRRPSPTTLLALAAALTIDPSQLAAVRRSQWTLSDLRSFRGRTKADVASHLGLARSTYDAIEACRRPLQDRQVAPIAAFLGCSESVVRAAYRRTQREHTGDGGA